MANNDKLLRAHYLVAIAYPEYAVNPLEPTASELNNLFAFGTAEDGLVFNISGAILDDSNNINQTGSDTDSTMTIVDVASVETPTFWNYEVTFDGLRDRDIDAAGVYNLLRELTIAPDRPFIVITRVGPHNEDPAAIGDVISLFAVDTDLSSDITEDGGLIQHTARFKPSGSVNINFKVVA